MRIDNFYQGLCTPLHRNSTHRVGQIKNPKIILDPDPGHKHIKPAGKGSASVPALPNIDLISLVPNISIGMQDHYLLSNSNPLMIKKSRKWRDSWSSNKNSLPNMIVDDLISWKMSEHMKNQKLRQVDWATAWIKSIYRPLYLQICQNLRKFF